MINSIIKANPTVMRDFLKFLIDKGFQQAKLQYIIEGTILDSLGYYQSFFATKSIYIIHGHSYFVVYKLFENNRQDVLIAKQFVNSIDNIMLIAVAKTIEYLEKPF